MSDPSPWLEYIDGVEELQHATTEGDTDRQQAAHVRLTEARIRMDAAINRLEADEEI